MDNLIAMTVGKQIKKYREALELTQNELARDINIAQSTLACYEKGKREANYETICKLCDRLGIEPNDLFSLI